MEQDTEPCLSCPVKGKCCYFSIKLEGHNIILWEHPCKFLDPEKHLCTVYEDRFNVFKFCLTREQGKQRGGLPIECPFLKGVDEKYLKEAVVEYDSVKDLLSEKAKIQYQLAVESSHDVLFRYDFNDVTM